MEEIYEPNSRFDFNKIVLSSPTSILGGNYFIKLSINNNPLYIQSPKCNTKNGITKAGKKFYCDLMMSNEHEMFIQWLENLENYVQECIYTNRSKWFETALEKHDIENSFASSVKTYKSGKFYITRTNVPSNLGKCSLTIYDENENIVELEQIKDTTTILTILEIQGIKCSARSFQIEIELKQMMVLKPSKLFEKCIIKSQNTNKPIIFPSNNLGENQEQEYLEDNDLDNQDNIFTMRKPNIIVKSEESTLVNSNQHPLVKSEESNLVKIGELNLANSNEQPLVKLKEQSLVNYQESNLVKSEEQSLAKFEELTQTNPFEMTEIDFDLTELPENETIQIKNRNDVYYQMYREAKKKAKMARDLALSTYLEAKRIKNTYMLDELDDESDLDEDEIKQVDE
jgi:hypothetical protein